jgi:hypothetical protein
LLLDQKAVVSLIQINPRLNRQKYLCNLLPEHTVKYPSSRETLEKRHLAGVLYFRKHWGGIPHPEKLLIKQAEVSVYFTFGTQSKVSFIQRKLGIYRQNFWCTLNSGTQGKVSFIQRNPGI